MKKNLELVNLKWNDTINVVPSKLFKQGTKFRVAGDTDPWYIVGTINDDNNIIVVYKSWAKHKQYWTYRCEEAAAFVFSLSLNGELYKDDKEYYIIDNCNKN